MYFMNSKYKIIFIIATLLLVFSLSLPIMNYVISLHNAQEQLKNSSLPLSTDNIYSEIQTHLIEPNIVASMMAQDTFLKDWLIHSEKKNGNIQKFLESIKNKYKMHTVFLASQKTKNYYSSKGFVEKMNEEKAINAWYYTFRDTTLAHEVNIDFNEHIDNSLIMFINHKIFDGEYHLLGITGVGLKLSYIDAMLKKFRQEYKFEVSFVAEDGKIIIQERGKNYFSSLQKNKALYKYKEELFSNKKESVNYTRNGDEYLVHSKFIPELNLYLLVQAKVSDFTYDVKQAFFLNLLLSLLLTAIIVLIIIQMIQKHSEKLENIANYDSLTELLTRRFFNDKIQEQLLRQKRKEVDMSILFLDIDNFKHVNDTFGHDIGDKVLLRVAQIMKNNVREIDYISRWGGEEFIIALIDSSLEESQKVAEKIRIKFEEDSVLFTLLSYKLTSSFGLTQIKENDRIEDIVKRADKALYEAKNTGKNKVVLA